MKCNWIIRFSIIGLIAWVGSVCAQGFGGMDNSMSRNVANQISRTISSNISKNLTDRILMPQLKIRNESGEIKDFSISADSRFFTLLHEDNTVRVWDARQGIQRPVISPARENITKVASVSALNITLLGTDEGDIDVYDVYTGRKVSQLKSVNEEVVALSVSKDESLLAVAHENGEVIIWDLKTLSIKKSIKTSYDDDLQFVGIEANAHTIIVAGEGGFVDRWNIGNAEKIAVLAKHTDDVAGLWVSDIYGGVASIDDDEVFQLIGANNAIKLQKEIENDPLSVALSEDLTQLAVSIEGKGIKVFDANTMNIIKQIPHKKKFTYLQFINQGKQLLAADKKGILYLFSVSNAIEIMKLVSTKTGWTIIDNKGRFDSSEKGMVNVSWAVEEFELPIDNFSGSHYEPGLLASYLNEQPFINKNPLAVQQGIRLPPQSVIIIPDGNRTTAKPIIVTVEAQGLGGGVEQIRLYHNGKVVTSDTIVNSQQQTTDKLIKKTVDFQLFPTVGENTFKVIATNKLGIEGHSEEVVVDFAGEKQKITLHVLTIGINQYKDPKLKLNYSVADATEITNIFKQSKFPVYDEIVHHQLLDKEATKEAILKQLNNASQYSQNDIMVIYLAGHGLAIDGTWYYLPYETMLRDNEEYYTQVGLSANEIQIILTQSKVQHFMVMVDACYSGAGLAAFQNLQYTQRHFSRGLSKSVGVVVLAATRKDQEAAELTDLGHGLFTYVVSEGLSGKADLKPFNRKISAHEIAGFSTLTIPAFSKKYLGASQEPTAFTMGSDFTLLRQQ